MKHLFRLNITLLAIMFWQMTVSAQTLTNTFTLERSTNGLRLRYSLADTNGVFFILQSRQVTNILGAGQVLASGAAVSNRTGNLDLVHPTNSPAFFELFQYHAPPPGPPSMVWIPPGTFVMGSPVTEKERHDDEVQHTVTLTAGFYMSKYLVTQGQYLAVTGNNPSQFTTQDENGKPIRDLNRPVETVSWYDATNYCGAVTASERAAGRLPSGWVYRLPTESEWEYACRAGTTTVFHYGNDLRSGMANFDGRGEYVGGIGFVDNPNGIFLRRTTTVGSYAPNAFGLYDMHGNVFEWCLDWYGSYPVGSVTNPTGPSTGSYRVIRGGHWYDYATDCRSAYRNDNYEPVYLDYGVGFRPVLAPAQ